MRRARLYRWTTYYAIAETVETVETQHTQHTAHTTHSNQVVRLPRRFRWAAACPRRTLREPGWHVGRAAPRCVVWRCRPGGLASVYIQSYALLREGFPARGTDVLDPHAHGCVKKQDEQLRGFMRGLRAVCTALCAGSPARTGWADNHCHASSCVKMQEDVGSAETCDMRMA